MTWLEAGEARIGSCTLTAPLIGRKASRLPDSSPRAPQRLREASRSLISQLNAQMLCCGLTPMLVGKTEESKT